MAEREVKESRSYEEALRVVLDRAVKDPFVRVPARIEAYLFQVKLNKRPLREAIGKVTVLLNRTEHKYPEVYEWLTEETGRNAKGSSITRLTQIRSRILP